MLTENKQDSRGSVGEYSSLTANLRGVAKQAVKICTVSTCFWFEGSCPLFLMNYQMQTLSLESSISFELLFYLSSSKTSWLHFGYSLRDSFLFSAYPEPFLSACVISSFFSLCHICHFIWSYNTERNVSCVWIYVR